MGMNKNIMDKYSFTLKEYEDFVFEYTGLFGKFCRAESKWETNEINGSVSYNFWVDYYADYYINIPYPCNEKYENPWGLGQEIALDDPNRPIYLTKFEYEQILSILTTEFMLVLDEGNRESFGNSLGVRYVKETFFTYYTSKISRTGSSRSCSQRPVIPNSSMERWSEQKLLTTYRVWVEQITSALCDADSFSDFDHYKEELQKMYGFSAQYFKLLDKAIGFCERYYVIMYFTPKILKYLLEDIKNILEKNPDISEVDSKNEVLNFILDVVVKVAPAHIVEKFKGNWDSYRSSIPANTIRDIFHCGVKIYSEESIFNRKEWIKNFHTEVCSANSSNRGEDVTVSYILKDFKSIN